MGLFEVVFAEKLAAERAKMQLEQQLRETKDKLDNLNGFTAEIKLKDELIAELKAKLAVSDASIKASKSDAKAEYADHAIAITDDRIKDMRSMYENFATKIIEVIKASNTPCPQPVAVAPSSPQQCSK